MMGRRLILIVCVIVLFFAGVGYSAWTEGLSIKSLFATGNIHVIFQDPVIVNNELYEITVDANEGVLEIYGTAAPDSTILVEYDIYNGSSIPVMYDPDDEDLPDGIALDQDDTVIKQGESILGNRLTIVPGEDELILPFVQYNSKDSGGWKEELKICWNITIVEETVDPELDMINENALTVEEATGEEPPENVPAGKDPTEDVPVGEEPTEKVPETEPPMTETGPGVEPAPDTDPNDPAPGSDPAADTPAAETPSDDSANNQNSNEETVQSESPTETNDDNLAEDNTESDEGSVKNVEDGEE